MTCANWREAISAVADGEDPGVDERLLDAHLARCPSCRDYRDQVERHRRTIRIREADAMPDLSRRIVKLNAVADRMSRWRYARAALAIVAIEIIVMSVPALIFGDESATSAHAARHLGAFSIAYAVGLLVVVARPARARTILPVSFVLAGALLLTSVIDVANGSIPLVTETGHLPELLSVLLVWLLAMPAPRRDAATVAAAPGRMRLVRPPQSGADRSGRGGLSPRPCPWRPVQFVAAPRVGCRATSTGAVTPPGRPVVEAQDDDLPAGGRTKVLGRRPLDAVDVPADGRRLPSRAGTDRPCGWRRPRCDWSASAVPATGRLEEQPEGRFVAGLVGVEGGGRRPCRHRGNGRLYRDRRWSVVKPRAADVDAEHGAVQNRRGIDPGTGWRSAPAAIAGVTTGSTLAAGAATQPPIGNRIDVRGDLGVTGRRADPRESGGTPGTCPAYVSSCWPAPPPFW